MANMLARLGVVLGLDSAEFVRGIDAAGKKLEQFSQKAEVYGKAGAVAFAAMTIAAVKYADEVADTAKANDVAVDSILKLQHALQESGGEAANASRLLSSFNSFVDKAATGNFEAQKSFKQMGVSLKDIEKMSIDEMSGKVAESLSKIEDPITRNAKAVEVFGRAAKGVDFLTFNQQLEHGTGLTKEQEKAILDAADAWGILEKRTHEFVVMVSGSIGSKFLQTIEYIDNLTAKTSELSRAFQIVFETVAVTGATVVYWGRRVWDEVAFAAENAKILATQGIEAARKANQEFDRVQQQRSDKLDEFNRRMLGGGGGYGGGVTNFVDPRRLDVKKDTGAAGRELKEAVNKEADALQKVLNKLKEKQAAEQLAYETKQKMFEIDRAGQYMLKEDVTLAKEIFEIKAKQKVMVDEINRAEKISPKQKAELVQAEKDIADAAERQARARNEIAKIDREKSFGQGFGDAMQKFFREAPTQMEAGAQAFQSVVSNMDAALSNFVRNGKFSFADLTRSIIQDLIVIQMRMAMIGLFRMAFGGAGAVTTGAPLSPSMSSAPVFAANGSDAQAGQPFYVGERGPELFVPNSSGTIIPNGSLAGAMGGGGQTVNYNGPFIQSMSAIDTQSGIQFLAKNKSTIWAVNQSAQRSLPVSK